MANLAAIIETSTQSPTAVSHRTDLCELLKRELRHKDRREVASSMGVSIHVLNGWVAEGRRQSRFPAECVDSFCRTVGSDALRIFLLGPELASQLRLGQSLLAASNTRGVLRFRRRRQ